MKAVVCTKYGPPEVLKLVELEKPTPKDDEVLVKIRATSVSAADSRVRGFNVPLAFWLPARLALGLRKPKKAILGVDFAGEIEQVGKDIKLFKKGDKVFGYTGHSRFGCYEEYICLPEKSVITRKPKNLTFIEAAAVPFGGNTALYFLKKAAIRRGQRVLIYGASGAVGTYAVQLAKYFGAEVTGVCSGKNVGLVQSLGADNVIDYKKGNFAQENKIYDVIFDTVGKSSFSDCMRALKKDGTYLQTVALPPLSTKMWLTSIVSKKKLIGGTALPKTENLLFLKKLIEEGKLKPVIDRIYTLEQIVEAHRYVDKGHKKGAVVITVDYNNKEEKNK